MKIILTALLSLVIISLQGCLGGDDSGGVTTDQASANGFWSGTFTESGAGTLQMRGFLQDGHIIFSAESGDFIAGSYKMEGTNLSGTTSSIYAGVTSSISGTQSGDSITASFSTSGQTIGNLQLSRDQSYNKTTSLENLVGSWSYTSQTVNREVTIYYNGAFEGSNSNGCFFTGLVEDIYPKNVFKMTMNVTGCEIQTYRGYAMLADSHNPNDILITLGHNSVGGVYGVFYK
jgi:hypothetical protein